MDQIQSINNPLRFKNITEVLENDEGVEYGFKIEGSDYIYYYDNHNGFTDEFGNYYDKQGDPSIRPSVVSIIKPQLDEDYEDDEEVELDEEQIKKEREELKQIIGEYPNDKDVQIHFENMDIMVKVQDIKNFFSKQKKCDFKKIVIDGENKSDEEGHSGNGYVVVSKNDALSLVDLHETMMEFQQYKNYVALNVIPYDEEADEEADDDEEEYEKEFQQLCSNKQQTQTQQTNSKENLENQIIKDHNQAELDHGIYYHLQVETDLKNSELETKIKEKEKQKDASYLKYLQFKENINNSIVIHITSKKRPHKEELHKLLVIQLQLTNIKFGQCEECKPK